MVKVMLVFAAISGAVSVILGAFGAHALRGKLPDNLFNAFHTGVEYQMYHALALLLVGVLLQLHPASVPIRWSGFLFMAGIILFSGSLYGLSLMQIKLFGPITPIGGLAFIAGWLLLVYGLIKTEM